MVLFFGVIMDSRCRIKNTGMVLDVIAYAPLPRPLPQGEGRTIKEGKKRERWSDRPYQCRGIRTIMAAIQEKIC
jgi:hypothetical protein